LFKNIPVGMKNGMIKVENVKKGKIFCCAKKGG
jgi:hypothetical protein